MKDHIKNHYKKYLMLIVAVMVFIAGALARPTMDHMKRNFTEFFYPKPITFTNVNPDEEGIRKIESSQGAKEICHLFAVNRYYAEKAEDSRTKMLSYDKLGTDTAKEYNKKLDNFIYGMNSDAAHATTTKKK